MSASPPLRRVLRRAVSAGTTLGLVIAGSTTVVAALAPTPAAAATAAPSAPQDLTTGQAVARATATGKPVRADAATTEDSTLTANPDGTLTLNQSLAPVRKWSGSSWVDLDPTLKRNADGSITTTQTSSGLTLSPGGAGPLATLADRGRSLALTLPMALPEPVLSGPTATYPDVLPDVDLVATADAQGSLSEVLVVKSAAAAANPTLKSLTLATSAKGLQIDSDAAGNITARDAHGPVYTAPAPTMWDSAKHAAAGLAQRSARSAAGPAGDTAASGAAQPGTAEVDPANGEPVASSAAGPGEAAHVAPIAVQTGTHDISLTPDASLLTGGGTTYPVYIDPTLNFVAPSASSSLQGWTYTNSYYSDSSFWKTSDATGLRVGYNDWESPFYKARAYLQISVPSKIFGSTTKVLSSQLNITETWSASCTAKEVQLVKTGSVSSSTTWSNQPALGSVVDSQTVAHGWSSSCPAKGVGFDISGPMQTAATGSTSSLTFALKASETDDLAWKKFQPSSTSVSTTYDIPPDTPSSLSTSPSTSCSHAVTVGDGNVTLYAKVTDKNGGVVGATFTAKNHATGATLGTPSDPNSLNTNSGSTLSYKLAEATLKASSGSSPMTVDWTVKASDGKYTGGTASCSFVFDPTRPGSPDADVPPGAVIGTRTTVAITCKAADGCIGTTPGSYEVQLNGGAPHSIAADSAGNATVAITPSRRTNVVTVTALSPGGNYGPSPAVVTFDAAPAAVPADGDLTGDGLPDLLTVGKQNGLPSGLWLAPGQTTAAAGVAVSGIADIGVSGTGVNTSGSAADFDGTQAITGMFTGAAGSGLQAVLDYDPATGAGSVIDTNGDGSPLAPTAGNQTTVIKDNLFDPYGNSPLQVANAGHTYTPGGTLPDLIGVSGDAADGYSLVLYGVFGDSVGQFLSWPLTNASPDGTKDWDQWTIATTQLPGGTAMFLWNKSTGDLQLWEDLKHNQDTDGTDSLGYTAYTLAAGTWNKGTATTLQAADINGDGTPDLWTTTGSAASKANLVKNLNADSHTGVVTASAAATLTAPGHSWPLDQDSDGNADGTIATVNDTVGTLALTGNAGASWGTGDDLRNPDANLDGTSGALTASGPALSSNTAFTVSAWVNPDALGGTAVSQDATKADGFQLYSDSASGTWRFSMPQTDAASPVLDTASGTAVHAHVGAWAHLVATYDPSGSRMSLYADGILLGTATHTATSWNATGKFTVGQVLSNGAHTGFFNGQLDDVQTWTKALTAAQVAGLDGTTAAAKPSGTLASKVSGMCADDPSGTLTNGTKMQIYTCNGTPAQNWTFYPDGTVRPDTHSATCVDVTGGATAAGTLIQLYGCNATASQQWQTLADGQLMNPHSGLCLADPGSSTTIDTQLQLAACNSGTAVTWTLPKTGPVNHWLLNESTGTSAHDSAASNDLTTTGGATWGSSTDSTGRSMPAATLNGTTGGMETKGWGVDTTGSFTVSAWVRLNNLTANQDIASQGGTTFYAFDLYYSSSYNSWIFNRAATDAASPTLTRAKSIDGGVTPVANTWTQLTGVYDATTDPAKPVLRLYVNGALTSTVAYTDTAWDARGHLDIGHSHTNGVWNSFVGGSIADVQRYNRPLTDAEAYSGYATGTDAGIPSGHWRLDDGSGTTAADAVGLHDATLNGTGTWSTEHNGSLALDGATGYLDTAGPVLDTTRSLTVSAWVKLNDTAANSTFLGQDGVHGSGFQLYYSTAYGWTFNRHVSDVVGPVITRSYTGTAAVSTGVWTHLTGVYDDSSRTVQLFVNGVAQGTPVSFTTPWSAGGNFQIGRRWADDAYAEYANGSVSDVTVWNSALTPTQIAHLG
ncbi:LamG-like jellyroll fold domain-containing protein [Peterkaempfera sp. SMS 1(5)a]|uniref:LamG-like jellyroll fold domain-containing protein n=1 Tax=Peterkaempfera podocarpi TaxID=3232308 RepID=UPI00366CF89A